jgi:hypothetical protein
VRYLTVIGHAKCAHLQKATQIRISWVLLIVAALKRAPSIEDVRAFVKVINAASFLFDEELVAYLKEVEKRVHRANGLNDMMAHFPDHDKPKASKHILWLSEQHNVIQKNFGHRLN